MNFREGVVALQIPAERGNLRAAVLLQLWIFLQNLRNIHFWRRTVRDSFHLFEIVAHLLTSATRRLLVKAAPSASVASHVVIASSESAPTPETRLFAVRP